MKTRLVYSQRIAGELMKMGYKPFATTDNPYYPGLIIWYFERVDGFDKDFKKLAGPPRKEVR